MTEEIAAAVGGGVEVGVSFFAIGFLIWVVTWSLVALAALFTAFRNPAAHKRIRGLLRDMRKSPVKALTGRG